MCLGKQPQAIVMINISMIILAGHTLKKQFKAPHIGLQSGALDATYHIHAHSFEFTDKVTYQTLHVLLLSTKSGKLP